jgi:hypothetical protein
MRRHALVSVETSPAEAGGGRPGVSMRVMLRALGAEMVTYIGSAESATDRRMISCVRDIGVCAPQVKTKTRR